jgi:glycosyltransferase involved in cell wall biosynthesis
MSKIDIIIATYNRHEAVVTLINQLENSDAILIGAIIVIDSSDKVLQKQESNLWKKTKILHSTRKSQPYQRYLGFQHAKSQFLLFLDDDMEILDKNFANYLVSTLEKENYVGMNLKFENANSFLEIQNKNSIFRTLGNSYFINLFRKFSGYPILKPNAFSWNGNKGKRTDNLAIEFVSGGAFITRKNSIFNNFNAQIFDIFEQKMAMGEDSIIGYLISIEGVLFADSKTFFLHNDKQESLYTINESDYTKRVVFSRWFLSKEFARINKKPQFLATLIFIWYIWWRFIGIIINSVVKNNFHKIDGFFKGISLIMKFRYRNISL